MVSNSKVLTVSYGTFSCTLEGFEDSFDTMKSIAEYFRDLAADDRYFGAEPPTPDATVLAAIAEKELSRQVIGRVDGNAVTLRPTELALASDIAAEEALEAEEAARLEAERIAKSEQDAEAKAKAEEDAKAQQEAEAKVKAEQDAKAQQEAEAKAKAEEDAKAQQEAEAKAKAEQDAEAQHEAEAKAKAEQDAKAQQEAEAKAEAEEDAKAQQEAEAKAKAEEDAKAQQEAEAKAEEDEELDADTPSSAVSSAADNAPTAFMEDTIGFALETDDGAESLEAMMEEDVEDADLTNLRALAARRAQQLAKDESATPDQEQPAQDLQAEDAQAPLDPAPLPATQDAALDDDPMDATDDPVGADLDDEPVELDDDTTVLQSRDTVADADPESAATVTPRIIKVKKSDLAALDVPTAAALADTTPNDLDGLDEFLSGATAIPLSQDADADLLAALEEVREDTIAQEDTPAALPPLTLTNLVAPDAGQTARKSLDTQFEVDRILDQTNDEMDRPEQRTRHDTYNQMKVAVAASDAQTRGSNALEMEQTYREDLAKVVKPLPATKPATPPLKLVASQRIDTTPHDAAGTDAPAPITPRRMGEPFAPAPAQPAPIEVMSFDEYLAKTGATDLPEVLEAAAAYTAFVEGNGAFSRPQVMMKVSKAMNEEFSREDCLKVFGMLLRNGTLRRERGGQFAIDADSRYGDLARAAG